MTWTICNPGRFFIALRAEQRYADRRIQDAIHSALRGELARLPHTPGEDQMPALIAAVNLQLTPFMKHLGLCVDTLELEAAD